ncbi:MAG: hypothetical protein LBG92_05700 [Prevotellaceae bacterium]|jgi:hypothetical protein|nr:hypothetical protein [Prevotellaceae bacterium]
MKTNFTKLFVLILLVSTVIPVQAQFSDEFLQIGTNDVHGTARFSAMGGAFNALGGDFSSLSSNPAGIGVYRSSEFTVTPELLVNRVSTDFLRKSMKNNRVRFAIPSIGYVGAWYNDDATTLTSFNIGLGYNRTAFFYKTADVQGFNSERSVLDFYAINAGNNTNDWQTENGEPKDFKYINPNNWATAIAANPKGPMIEIPQGEAKYKAIGLNEGDKVDIAGRALQSGSTGEFAISLGGNISNKLQFGLTVGIQDLDIENYLKYEENYVIANTGNFTSHTRSEYTRNSGMGYNLKAGIIYRPIQSLRLGFAAHTPTFFSIKREYNVYSSSSYWNVNENKNDFFDEQSPTDVYEYNFATPYKLEFGAAYIVGKFGLVSVDYELVGYNAMNMLYGGENGEEHVYNDLISQSFSASSNLRIGAELNLPYGFVLRGGYNYFQNPYKDSKKLDFSRQAYSGGIGFRGKGFFVDFACVINSGNYYYAPYFVNEYRIRDSDGTSSYYAKEKSELGRIVATVGFKF